MLCARTICECNSWQKVHRIAHLGPRKVPSVFGSGGVTNSYTLPPPLLVLCPGLHDRGCMMWVIWSEIHDDDGYMTLFICSGLNYLGYVIWVKCSISCVWLRKIKDTFNLPLRSVQSVLCFCLSSPTPGLVSRDVSDLTTASSEPW